ncbi:V-type proton ATPase subunit E-like [Ornithodoros turicata]|uniref:V-type proton ATPase subunit E-like n=1 Tax=Ornithodoros turicata TaxID=34597 RepID=UPI003138EB46
MSDRSRGSSYQGGSGQDDVTKPIKHMLAFIEQEANEKVEEIDSKAEEEFNMEKGRLVQQQRIMIMDFYAKKEKQVERMRKIQSSHVKNLARLRILNAMNDHVDKVLSEAKGNLGIITGQEKRYRPFLERLILQGLYSVLEKDVIVTCRRKDTQIVQAALDVASKVYRKKTNLNGSIVLDKDNFLPDECFGGIELTAMKGRMKVCNTLDNRLSLISQKIMPQIRSDLFGPNPNRKHFD